MKAKSNSTLPKVVTTTKNNGPTKKSTTQKDETKKLPAVVLNEKIAPVQLLVDPPVITETTPNDSVVLTEASFNDLTILTETTTSKDIATEAQSTVIPEPILPQLILSPEELVERRNRNEEFLFCCGKYNGKDTFGDPHKARILFDRGIDVDYIDSDGWSALFYAAGEGHSRLVQWLVEDFHATVDLKAPDECTALWTACFNGHRDVVSYLLRIGADDTVQGKPPGEPVQSPAMAARRNRHPGIADFVDFESDLRKSNPGRRKQQIEREMTREEFRESMKSSPQFLVMEGGSS